jgi:hypothetical protein
VLKITGTTVTDANAGGGTFQIEIQSASNSPSVTLTGELEVPALSLDVPLFSAGLNGATSGGQPNGGGLLNANFGALNYTLLGSWDYQSQNSGGTNYTGYSMAGFQTPTAGIPASGTAVYTGSAATSTPAGGVAPTIGGAGGAVGRVYFPDPAGNVVVVGVAGNASLAVNFNNGTVAGSLTGMKFQGAATLSAWNDVQLAGNLSGGTLAGATSTGAAPAGSGNAGFSSSSTGKFNGALYGPNAQEVGAIWSLYDPSGKAAIGGFAASK